MSAGTAAVLAALHRACGRACSGEALSAELGVSRAAIWKQIETLRKRGYEVDGSPGGGYSLRAVPDRLYAEEISRRLTTRWLGRELTYLDSTDSTNRVAFELATRGAAHGTAVVAEQQTAGRGRLGRTFFSPAYQNLYTSIVLRPELTIAEAPTLILTSAVAVAETVAETLVGEPQGAARASVDSPRIEIKWPNDVLVDGLKTSGILMEMSTEGTRTAFVILGIGVNLNVSRDSFPEEFRRHATSLRTHLPDGSAIDRVQFTARLYGKLEDVLDVHAASGFPGLRSRFDACFRMPGRSVEVAGMNGEILRGVARGIASDGALEVETTRGTIERVVAGDVTLSPRKHPGTRGAQRRNNGPRSAGEKTS